MRRRFVEVVRPRLLCVALARRFGSRYYAAPADSQSAVAVNGGGEEVSQLNLVKDFKGRERDSFPCLSRYHNNLCDDVNSYCGEASHHNFSRAQDQGEEWAAEKDARKLWRAGGGIRDLHT